MSGDSLELVRKARSLLAAAARAALEASKVCSRRGGSREYWDIDRGEWRPCNRCDGTRVEPDIPTALITDAGRALLVSLRAAEAERDALRAENERLNRAIGAATSIGRKVLVALESDDEMLCEDRADAFQSACEQMVSMLSGSGAVIVEGAE